MKTTTVLFCLMMFLVAGKVGYDHGKAQCSAPLSMTNEPLGSGIRPMQQHPDMGLGQGIRP